MNPSDRQTQAEALAQHIERLKSLLAVSERLLVQLETADAGEAPADDPAAEDVALVVDAAPLFDAAWYIARYDLPAGTDAAHHYLAEGAGLGFDPGPDFSTGWYLEQNADVRGARANPLLHYLRHGRDEGRLPKPLDDAALLRSSDLFDAGWYLRQNPDVAEDGTDPVDHYLATGVAMDRDPGPGFSTRAYLDEHPDVVANALNPLAHYLRHGQAEGRRADLSREIPISADMVDELRASGLFDAAWYLDRYPQVAAAGRDPAIDYLALGARDGRDPGPGFSTGWYLHAYPDVVLGAYTNPFLHYVRHGMAEGRQPRMAPPDFEQALRPASAARVRRIARSALRGATRLAAPDAPRPDAVPVGEAGMTVLLGTPLGRAGPNDAAIAPVLDGLTHLHGLSATARGDLPPTLSGLGIAVGDLWFVNDGLARMRIDAGADGVFATPLRLRAFQIEGERLAPCGDAVIAGDGPRFVDIAPPNPFLPLLFVTTDMAGTLHGAALLPFPSLCRGGAHQAETCGDDIAGSGLRAACRASDTIVAGWRGQGDALIAAIAIDGTEATGAERLFSWPVREWLATIARVPVTWERPGPACAALAGPSTPAADVARGADAALRLVLPADSLPTIAALFARAPARVPAEGVAGSFLLAEPIGGEPCFAVGLPARSAVGLPALQPADAPLPVPCLFPAATAMAGAPDGLPSGWPLAIRFHRTGHDQHRLVHRRPVELPGPLLRTPAMAGATVTVIIPAITRDDGAAVLLASLARQTVAAAIDAIPVVPADRDDPGVAADRFFPGRHHIVRAQEGEDGLSRAVALAGGDYLLFVHEGGVLHDPRTVETLLALVAAPHVASAACLHIHTRKGAQAAIEPGGSGLFAAIAPDGTIALADAAGFAALPRATYPNAGNGLACTLVPTALWRALDTPGVGPVAARGRDYARKALERGLRHLATSAVTVMIEADVDAGSTAVPIPWDGPADAVPRLRRIAP